MPRRVAQYTPAATAASTWASVPESDRVLPLAELVEGELRHGPLLRGPRLRGVGGRVGRHRRGVDGVKGRPVDADQGVPVLALRLEDFAIPRRSSAFSALVLVVGFGVWRSGSWGLGFRVLGVWGVGVKGCGFSQVV